MTTKPWLSGFGADGGLVGERSDLGQLVKGGAWRRGLLPDQYLVALGLCAVADGVGGHAAGEKTETLTS